MPLYAPVGTGLLKVADGFPSIAAAGDLPSHTHDLADITDAGTVAAVDLSGNASEFLKGDGSWAAGGGGYTDEQAQDAVGSILSDAGDIDFNYDDAAPNITATVKSDAVTYGKMQNVSATNRFLGRITGGAGDVEELTGTQATTLLDAFTSALKGLVPASGGGTSNFLRADGTFAAPTAADPAGWTTIVKSANQDVTNAGVTNDSEFNFAVVAGGHYMIDMDLVVSGNNTTGDYIMDIAVSAGTMKGKGTCQNLTAAGAIQNIIATAAAAANITAIVTGAPTADIDDLVFINLHYAFTASADATCRFRFGNSAAAGGRTSRTWKGSIMRHKRLD